MRRETIYTDGAYLEANPTWHEEDSSWKAKQIISMLSAHGIVPSTVGEVGCGAGEILNCLAAHYGDAVAFSGFDVSPQAFDICRRKQRQNLQFFLGNFFDTKGLPFGVVLAIDVIEHIEDYFTFLRNLKTKGAYKIWVFRLFSG